MKLFKGSETDKRLWILQKREKKIHTVLAIHFVACFPSLVSGAYEKSVPPESPPRCRESEDATYVSVTFRG